MGNTLNRLRNIFLATLMSSYVLLIKMVRNDSPKDVFVNNLETFQSMMNFKCYIWSYAHVAFKLYDLNFEDLVSCQRYCNSCGFSILNSYFFRYSFIDFCINYHFISHGR